MLNASAFLTLILSLCLLSGTGWSTPQPDRAELIAKSNQAQEALNSGRFDRAAELYGELVDALPEIGGIRMNLGMALYLGGNARQAVPVLEKAVSQDPNLPPAWLFLGAARLESGDPENAVAPLERYLETYPTEVRALELLAEAALLSGDLDKSLTVHRKLVESAPQSPRAWFGLGRTFERIAEAAFNQIDERAPETAYWFALIAASRLAQQQYSSAFYFYRKALEEKPGLPGIHAALAHIYTQTDHSDWAEAELRRESQVGPPDCADSPNACLMLEGKFDQVIDRTEAPGQSPEALYWRAQAANRLAVRAFEKVDELPPSFEAHRIRADIHRNQNRHWESVREWQEALKLEPENPIAKRELALSLYLNRDYDGTLAMVRELLPGDPDSGQLNFLAGDSLLYQQKVEESIPYLEKAVKSEPDLLGAQSALGRAYMHLGEAEKAIPHLRQALPIDEDGSLLYQLALAQQRTGDRDAARKTMARYQEVRRTLQAEDRRLEEEVKITAPE